ncbi:MAG: hypothetical protein ACRCZF_08880, partial [Gemmataceae bacterium]
MLIRKIQVDGPTLDIERDAEGHWSLAGLGKAGPADRLVPTFVITGATVHLRDSRAGGFPKLSLSEARLTLVNDPLPILKADGQATLTVTPPAGAPVAVRAVVHVQLNRVSGQMQLGVELPEIPLTTELIALASGLDARFEALRSLAGRVSVKAEASIHPDATIQYDLKTTLTDGAFQHPALPWPVKTIQATARLADGQLTIDKATAQIGPAQAEFSVVTRKTHAQTPIETLDDLEARLETLTVQLRHLPINNALFDQLPPKARKAQAMFQPNGPAHVRYQFRRPVPHGWSREILIEPMQMNIVYEKFRYPMGDVRGTVRKLMAHDGTDDLRIDISGTAAEQRIEVKGRIHGPGPDPAIELKISGNNVPIDDRIFDALPGEKYGPALKKLAARGRGDFVADVLAKQDENLTTNKFRISVYDGRMRHADFPYPLEQVRGTIHIHTVAFNPTRPVYPQRPSEVPPDTDHVELRDFEGRHAGGIITLFGTNDAVQGTPDRKLTLHIWGKDCPCDDALRQALAALRLEPVWTTFQPRGKLTFGVEVAILDRPGPPDSPLQGPTVRRGLLPGHLMKRRASTAPFEPTADLTLSLNFRGPSVTPDFFPYDLHELAGHIRFDGRRVKVENFIGKHGASVWKLHAGEVRFAPNGQIWSNIGGLS